VPSKTQTAEPAASVSVHSKVNVIVGAPAENVTEQVPATGLPLVSVRPSNVVDPVEPLSVDVKEKARPPSKQVASTVHAVCTSVHSIVEEEATAFEHADELAGSSETE